jgi:hypothetical protein
MSGGDEPTGARIFAACACAALVAGSSAAVTTWWELTGAGGDAGALPSLALALAVALPIAAAHALVLALPLYMALRERWPLRWWNAALGGFAVALVPAGLVVLPSGDIDIGVLRGAVGLGLFGAAGGVAFWIVLRDPRRAR